MAARKLGVIILAPLALLSLGTCGLFLASPFPLDMAQVMAVQDFSSSIPYGAEDYFKPWVVERDDARLILLVGGYAGAPGSEPWMYVMREDLSIVETYSINQLKAFYALFNGSGVMIDSDGGGSTGKLVVGNIRFEIMPDGRLAFLGPAGALSDFNERGFPQTAAPWDNMVKLWVDEATGDLNWHGYSFAWAGPAPLSEHIRLSGPKLYLRNVLAAPFSLVSPDHDVILAFEEEKDPTTDSFKTIFVKIPRSDFGGALPHDFLDDTITYPRLSRTNTNAKHASLVLYDPDTSVDGDETPAIVAYEYDTEDWTLTPLNTGEVAKRMHVGRFDDDEQRQVSSSYSRGYTCSYDRRTHVLTKAAKWWD